jgi:hypothetical protein
MKKNVIAILIGLVLLVTMGCQLDSAANQSGDSNLPYVLKLMKEGGKKNLVLDMTDPGQYDFMVKHIEATGATKANKPEIFTQLEEAKSISKLPGAGLPFPPIGPVTPMEHMISRIQSFDNGTFTVEAISSVRNGTYYSMVTLVIYNEAGQQISPIAYTVEEVNPANPVNVGQLIKTTITLPFPDSNNISMIYALSAERTNIGGTITERSTWEPGLVGPGAIQDGPMFVIQEPTDKNNNNIIDVCIDRNVYWYAKRQCDYPMLPAADRYRVAKVPFKGICRVPTDVSHLEIVPEETYIKLIPKDFGGSIKMSFNGQNNQGFSGAGLRYVKGDHNTLVSWDIPRDKADFIDGDLVKESTNLRGRLIHWYIKLTYKKYEMSPWGQPIETYYSYICSSNDIPAQYDPFAPTTPVFPPTGIQYSPIAFWFSCLAEGSMVTMADGSVLPVEKVRYEDKIMGANGSVLTVIGTAVGEEEKPMVRIVDEYKHNLLLTVNHPVKTIDGIVKASELKAGDVVDTEQGFAELLSVTQEKFNGRVYNLYVGTKDELTAYGENSNMFYADGYLVGDGSMQSCPACYADAE